MSEPLTIVVMEGDQTGQELLELALGVLDPEVLGLQIGLERFDLSLANRRATENQVVARAASAASESGFALKAATITPEGAGDVGSPNRLLREGVAGTVIIRTGRRLPGVAPVGGVHFPISVVRMAVGDAYGASEWREGAAGQAGEAALRTERITREVCRGVAEHSFRAAAAMAARVYGGPKWTVSPTYEGMLKEELDAAAARHADVPYEPVLIDAAYAGLIGAAAEAPLVIPALNRDGDCLSDLVMALFGSIAGAESVLLCLDSDYETQTVMAEAPHGTAPALQGKNLANPLAMILACAALLHHASTPQEPQRARASRAIYEAAMEVTGAGICTPDLGGHASSSEVADAIVAAVRSRLVG